MFYDPLNDRYNGKGYADKGFVKCIVGKKPDDAELEEFTETLVVNTHEHADWRKYSCKHEEIPEEVKADLVFRRIKTEAAD